MSAINKKPEIPIVEEFFTEEEEIEEYKPKHPAIAFIQQSSINAKADHLDDYVEVKPFEK